MIMMMFHSKQDTLPNLVRVTQSEGNGWNSKKDTRNCGKENRKEPDKCIVSIYMKANTTEERSCKAKDQKAYKMNIITLNSSSYRTILHTRLSLDISHVQKSKPFVTI